MGGWTTEGPPRDGVDGRAFFSGLSGREQLLCTQKREQGTRFDGERPRPVERPEMVRSWFSARLEVRSQRRS